jgi:hypothetical protein
MAYVLEERGDDGTSKVLGEPIHDIVVARVIAARRAARTRRVTIVRDRETGAELARFDGTTFVPAKSGQQMKAVDPGRYTVTSTLTRRRIS